MTRLFLHAGTHKTGTTAIQSFIGTHREVLLERGLLFPDLAPFAPDARFPHHNFAHALAGGPSPVTAEQAAELAGLWARNAAERGADVLLSAEPVYRHTDDRGSGRWFDRRAAYLTRLAACLKPFEVEVILVFRRPDDFIRSMFQEITLKDTRAKWDSFRAYRESALNRELQYFRHAELFGRIFGKVRCLIYEDLARDGHICHSFLQALGYDASDLPDGGTVQPSLSPQQTMLKHAVNARNYPESLNGKVVRAIRSPQISRRLELRLGPGPFDLWESPEARAELMAATATETERLREKYFPGRDRLFPENSRETLPPVPPVPPGLPVKVMRKATGRVKARDRKPAGRKRPAGPAP